MEISSVRVLGALIRKRREEVGMTAAETAELAGVSRRLLIELERGKRPNVRLSAVLRILALLGLEVQVIPRGLPGTRDGTRGRKSV
jgi:transcriptional regulator with XRE-family HTH domain